MPFGFLDTRYIDFPSSVDVAYIQGLQNREGVSFAEIVAELDRRLVALNSSLDPLLAALMYVTSETFADNTGPVAFTIEERSERTIARPQLAEALAHMLAIKGWDVSLGFTEDFLMGARMDRIITQFDSIVAGLKHLYRVRGLTRLFSTAEVPVDRKTSATSPGFAGSGTGSNAFTRPFPDGSALSGGYTNYWRDTAANRAVLIAAMIAHIQRWAEPPFDYLGSAAETTAVQALAGFVPAGSALVRVGAGTAEALVDPNVYIGVYNGVLRIRKPLLDFTTAHFAIFKSFGNLAPGNPLVWRYDPKRGRYAYVRYRSLFPLDQAVVIQDFDINVGNRVAAELALVAASGSYAAPTIA